MPPNEPPPLPVGPVGPEPEPIPPWARVLLFLALAAFFYEVILSLAFVAGAISLLLGGFLAARPLYLLGALDQDYRVAFASGVLLPVGVFLAAVLWRGIRAATTQLFDTPAYRPKWFVTGPTLFLLCWLAVHLMILVPVDRLELWDIDDGRLGGAVLGLVVLTCLALAWLVTRAGWRATAAAWRASRTRPILAGMVIVCAGGGAGLLSIADAVATVLGEASRQGVPSLAERDPIEASRLALVEVASGSRRRSSVTALASMGDGVAGTSLGGDGGDSFELCVVALHAHPPTPSEVEEALQHYEETLVWDALTDVCLRYARGGVKGSLREYFGKSLRNANYREHRSPWKRCDYVPWDSCQIAGDDDASWLAQQRAVSKILCELPPADAEILRLHMIEDLKGPEIAARLGISPAAARQRLTAVRRRVQQNFPELCR